MPALYIIIFTTIKEGLGTTVLDAFASHVPILGLATGEIPEMVKNGVTGMLSPLN